MKAFLLLAFFCISFAGLSQPAYRQLEMMIKKGDISSPKAKRLLAETRGAITSATTPSEDRIASLRLLCGLFDNNELGMENADSLLFYGKLLAQKAHENRDDEAEAEGLATTVIANSYLKNSLQVLKLGLSSLEIIENKNIPGGYVFQWMIINKIVYAYLFLGDYPMANTFTKRAIDLLKTKTADPKINRLLSDTYLTSARLHGYFKKLPEAMSLLDSALKYNGKTGNIQQSFYIKNDWASLRLDNGESDKAIPALTECLQYFKAKKNRYGIGEASMLLGKAWLLKGDFSKSVFYAKQAAAQPVNVRIQIGIYETLYKAYKATAQWQNSLLAQEKVIQLKESMFNDKLANEKQVFESRLVLQKQEQVLARQKQEAEIQKSIRNYAIIGVALLSVLAIFLIWNRRLILHKNRLIEIQKEKIEAMNSGLEAKVSERTEALQKAYDDIKDAMAKGQSQERKRVAAELHDTLGSLLSSVNFGLEALGNMNMSDRERKIFNRVVNITDDAYDEVRMLSHNYYPRELDQAGLIPALSILSEKLNLYSKTIFQFKSWGNIPRFSKEAENHLYAVCLELVNNIEKHARATQASVELSEKDGQLKLMIRDNGKGMDVNVAQFNGTGFRHMRERIETMAGSLAMNSSENGSTFEISVPIRNLIATGLKEAEPNHSG